MQKQTKLWITKNGNKIRICDMTDSHLLNTIKFLEKRASLECEYAKIYTPYPNFSGEMAQMCAEHEFDDLMNSTFEDFLPKIYINLLDEKSRRRL